MSHNTHVHIRDIQRIFQRIFPDPLDLDVSWKAGDSKRAHFGYLYQVTEVKLRSKFFQAVARRVAYFIWLSSGGASIMRARSHVIVGLY